MNQKEISDVYALQGGTMAWKNAGYPMEKTEGKVGAPDNLEGPKDPKAAFTPPPRPPVL